MTPVSQDLKVGVFFNLINRFISSTLGSAYKQSRHSMTSSATTKKEEKKLPPSAPPRRPISRNPYRRLLPGEVPEPPESERAYREAREQQRQQALREARQHVKDVRSNADRLWREEWSKRTRPITIVTPAPPTRPPPPPPQLPFEDESSEEPEPPATEKRRKTFDFDPEKPVVSSLMLGDERLSYGNVMASQPRRFDPLYHSQVSTSGDDGGGAEQSEPDTRSPELPAWNGNTPSPPKSQPSSVIDILSPELAGDASSPSQSESKSIEAASPGVLPQHVYDIFANWSNARDRPTEQEDAQHAAHMATYRWMNDRLMTFRFALARLLSLADTVRTSDRTRKYLYLRGEGLKSDGKRFERFLQVRPHSDMMRWIHTRPAPYVGAQSQLPEMQMPQFYCLFELLETQSESSADRGDRWPLFISRPGSRDVEQAPRRLITGDAFMVRTEFVKSLDAERARLRTLPAGRSLLLETFDRETRQAHEFSSSDVVLVPYMIKTFNYPRDMIPFTTCTVIVRESPMHVALGNDEGDN
jgi:hypothetical protein